MYVYRPTWRIASLPQTDFVWRTESRDADGKLE
jgi:hypothetical protein